MEETGVNEASTVCRTFGSVALMLPMGLCCRAPTVFILLEPSVRSARTFAPSLTRVSPPPPAWQMCRHAFSLWKGMDSARNENSSNLPKAARPGNDRAGTHPNQPGSEALVVSCSCAWVAQCLGQGQARCPHEALDLWGSVCSVTTPVYLSSSLHPHCLSVLPAPH